MCRGMHGQGGEAWSLACELWAPGDPQFQPSLPPVCGALPGVTVNTLAARGNQMKTELNDCKEGLSNPRWDSMDGNIPSHPATLCHTSGFELALPPGTSSPLPNDCADSATQNNELTEFDILEPFLVNNLASRKCTGSLEQRTNPAESSHSLIKTTILVQSLIRRMTLGQKRRFLAWFKSGLTIPQAAANSRVPDLIPPPVRHPNCSLSKTRLHHLSKVLPYVYLQRQFVYETYFAGVEPKEIMKYLLDNLGMGDQMGAFERQLALEELAAEEQLLRRILKDAEGLKRYYFWRKQGLRWRQAVSKAEVPGQQILAHPRCKYSWESLLKVVQALPMAARGLFLLRVYFDGEDPDEVLRIISCAKVCSQDRAVTEQCADHDEDIMPVENEAQDMSISSDSDVDASPGPTAPSKMNLDYLKYHKQHQGYITNLEELTPHPSCKYSRLEVRAMSCVIPQTQDRYKFQMEVFCHGKDPIDVMESVLGLELKNEQKVKKWRDLGVRCNEAFNKCKMTGLIPSLELTRSTRSLEDVDTVDGSCLSTERKPKQHAGIRNLVGKEALALNNPVDVKELKEAVRDGQDGFGSNPSCLPCADDIQELDSKGSSPQSLLPESCQIACGNLHARQPLHSPISLHAPEAVKLKCFIVPADYPKARFTEPQMDAIEDHVLEAILEMNDAESKPFFLDSYRKDGTYTIVCSDAFSFNWLFKQLTEFDPSLKITNQLGIKACLKLPLSKDDDRKIFKFIGIQNTGLEVSKWTILERLDSEAGTFMDLVIDEESAKVLRECTRIRFKFGNADIVVEGTMTKPSLSPPLNPFPRTSDEEENCAETVESTKRPHRSHKRRCERKKRRHQPPSRRDRSIPSRKSRRTSSEERFAAPTIETRSSPDRKRRVSPERSRSRSHHRSHKRRSEKKKHRRHHRRSTPNRTAPSKLSSPINISSDEGSPLTHRPDFRARSIENTEYEEYLGRSHF